MDKGPYFSTLCLHIYGDKQGSKSSTPRFFIKFSKALHTVWTKGTGLYTRFPEISNYFFEALHYTWTKGIHFAGYPPLFLEKNFHLHIFGDKSTRKTI